MKFIKVTLLAAVLTLGMTGCMILPPPPHGGGFDHMHFDHFKLPMGGFKPGR